jgi:hypothetical protein
MRTIFKSLMIVEVAEAGMEAAVVTAAVMGAAEGAGVRGHPGETGNAVAATDHDHGAEIDPVEVGDVPDPGNGKRKGKGKNGEKGKRKDCRQSRKLIYQFAAPHFGLAIYPS